MSFASVLLYPILLLLPAAGASDGAAREDAASETAPAPSDVPADSQAWPRTEIPALSSDSPLAASLLRSVDPLDAWQVRIEQRMTIRISPRASAPMPPNMFVGIPGGDGVPQMTERKIGKCVNIAGIAGVQPDRSNRLLLFMRDRRLVSAELDRSCRARDFYSGFYLERSDDGRLCVDRDTLLSRSGMNCKLTRIRELVEQDR